MLVVGDNEVADKGVNVRKYGEQKSETVSFDEFLESFRKEAKK
jgi:threonyl-tRNA synthetase